MERIVKLGRESALNAIKNEKEVMYKHGVWNSYTLVTADDAVKGILASGYGADVYTDGKMFYVSVPCDSDMW